ncbi:MAG: hypothetical protein ACLQBB_12860 [Solirubrobacteraceae bacterium]
MSLARHLRAAVAAALLAGSVPLALASASPAASGASSEAALLRALVHSRELWATIDVCSPKDQPDYVGIRGSMPGDKKVHDKMYMSFRLQYMDAATKQWVDLASGASPAYVYVGPGSTVRQGGRSFQLVPRTGKPASTLRGVVDYQWRRGTRIMQSASRTTEAGHHSLAGADPAGFSSASCQIG